MRWLVQRGWSWLLLRPGTRPRLAARRLAANSVTYVLERPRLARAAKVALRLTPTLRRHLHNLSGRSLGVENLSRHGLTIQSMLVEAAQRRGRKAG